MTTVKLIATVDNDSKRFVCKHGVAEVLSSISYAILYCEIAVFMSTDL